MEVIKTNKRAMCYDKSKRGTLFFLKNRIRIESGRVKGSNKEVFLADS